MFPQNVNEKMEIYRLGVFFFKLLAGDLPYKFESEGMEPPLSTVLQWILHESIIPKLPSDVETSDDPVLQVLKTTMRNCTQFNPDLRPTAYELSKILDDAVNRIANQS